MTHARTALITGATGFVGRATAGALERAGWRVIRGTRASPLAASGEVHIDLERPGSVLSLADEIRADAIVHLAAVADFSGSAGSSLYVPNVLSTGCLASVAAQWEAPLVFASGSIVHGIAAASIDADSPVAPDTPYGMTKRLGEKLIAASGAAHCILRIGGIFGIDGPSHLGMNRALAGARRGDTPTMIGSGAARRNYVYVEDVAAGIVFALDNDLRGTHLLAGSEVLSIAEMLRSVCDVFLPGTVPLTIDGPEAGSQVIAPSRGLPGTRSWRDALLDMIGARNR